MYLLKTFVCKPDEELWQKKRLSENGENKIYSNMTNWNIREIAHKEEELDSVFNEKQIKMGAITESNTKLKCE